MYTCTFFGNKDTPETIKSDIKNAIERLIITNNVTTFYVGHQGNFDRFVRLTLKDLKETYPKINYFIVLAYLPNDKYKFYCEDFSNTIFPDCLANVPPRFAIHRRNTYMLEKSDYVVCYVKNTFGGAAQFVEKAKRKKKTIINLS